jgi:hypothetical protein
MKPHDALVIASQRGIFGILEITCSFRRGFPRYPLPGARSGRRGNGNLPHLAGFLNTNGRRSKDALAQSKRMIGQILPSLFAQQIER